MERCPVSVVIPTFNRDFSVKRAVDSVFAQSLPCSELVIVDDGSTDTTRELLDSLSATAKVPLKIYHQDNKGPAAARNLGVAKASFPFIAFLDSDDHWYKRKLEKQYGQLLLSSDYQISHTREKWLRRGQHLNQKKMHIPRHGDIFAHCLQLCGVGMSTVMMKRAVFDDIGFFDETMRCCEDYDLWLRASCRYPFLLIDEPLTVKEGGRDDQVSSLYRLGMDKLRIYSLRKLLDMDTLDADSYLLTFNEFKKKVRIYGSGCLKHNKKEIGQSYLNLIPFYQERAVKKYPTLGELLDA